MNDITDILEAIDMESWLDMQGIDYRITHGSRGTQINVRDCPVCGSNKWKVYLNAETGLGNCFAGDHPEGENFNKWSFIKAELGGSNREVVDHLKGIVAEIGWLPKKIKAEPVQESVPSLQLPESVPIPYKGRNLAYLEVRGITSEAAKHFALRFSKSGVFPYRIKGKKFVQRYTERVIIPIHDLDGDLVSFQGRDTTGNADRKYLFPPGFASTSKLLYNAHNARGAKHVVVTEGVFDTIAVWQAFKPNPILRQVVPIATFGKHLSHADKTDQFSQFIRLKSLGLEKVTMMWDSESSAINAAIKAGKLLKSIGLEVNIAILPRGMDPNEAMPDEVIKTFESAESLTLQFEAKLKLQSGLT